MELPLSLAASFLSMVLSFALTYPVRYFAPKLGFMDIPKDDRRMHTEPKPRLGGVAIYLAFLISGLSFLCTQKECLKLLIPYALGGLIIAVVGLCDDKFSIKPIYKLLGQALAGVVLCLFGITLESVSIFGHIIHLGFFSYPITVLWVIAVTNVFNLSDGLDGLCCGLSILSASGLALLAFLNGSHSVTAVALVYVFACLGFLPHNTFPARIFMGDTGSMFSGFMLASIAISTVYTEGSEMSAFIPIIIFGIPVFDSVFAVFRRLSNGTNIFKGDKLHVHHRLSKRYGHLKAVILMYGATMLLCGIALITYLNTTTEIIGCVLALLAILYAVLRFGVYKD